MTLLFLTEGCVAGLEFCQCLAGVDGFDCLGRVNGSDLGCEVPDAKGINIFSEGTDTTCIDLDFAAYPLLHVWGLEYLADGLGIGGVHNHRLVVLCEVDDQFGFLLAIGIGYLLHSTGLDGEDEFFVGLQCP